MSPTRRLARPARGGRRARRRAWWLPLGSLPDQLGRLGPLAPVLGVRRGRAAARRAGSPYPGVDRLRGAVRAVARGRPARWRRRSSRPRSRSRPAGRSGVTSSPGTPGPRFARLEAWITREGMLAVAAVRSLPIGPYGFAGYAYGASGVRVRDYALGTTDRGAAVGGQLRAAGGGGGRRPSASTRSRWSRSSSASCCRPCWSCARGEPRSGSDQPRPTPPPDPGPAAVARRHRRP